MSEYQFSQKERFAVFTVHGPKCYLSGCLLDLQSMEIDHVIPEFLAADQVGLEKVLVQFGLPSDFSVNSYENWLPACRQCNGKKSGLVFNATPIIQRHLQVAAARAGKAREVGRELVKTQALSRAVNLICRAVEGQTITEEAVKPIIESIRLHCPEMLSGTYKLPNFPPDMIGMMIPFHIPAQVRLTPFHVVVMEENWRVIEVSGRAHERLSG